jgi:YVTN family beta-propeller protein
VHVVDLARRVVTDAVAVGYAPNGFAVNPSETKLYVSSFGGGSVAEIDLANDAVLRTFVTGGMPQDVIVSKKGDELYIANESGWIDVYDLATGQRAARIPLAGGGFGMAFSPDEAHLYVSLPSSGLVQVVNIHSRSIIHTIQVGGQPRRIAFTYHGGIAVVANESGKVDYVR